LPQEACKALVAAALEAGGYDNVSVGIFAVRAAGGSRPESKTATRTIEITDPGSAPEEAATRRLELPESLS
jgi:PPM family protein phosphatase